MHHFSKLFVGIFVVGFLFSPEVLARKIIFSKNNFKAETDGSVELIQNYLNNVIDLNQDKGDDEFFPAAQYMGNVDLIYSGLPLGYGDIVLHGMAERKGRLGYAANLAKVDISTTREIARYHILSQDMFPRLRELSLTTPLFIKGLKTTLGLHKYYSIGWTTQLFGIKDSNYGATVTYTHPLKESSLVYNFHWDKPDFNSKWRMQFKRPTMENNEATNHTNANRFTTDLSYYWKSNVLQAMVSGLWDRTKLGKRLIAFFDNLTVKKEFVGNVGGSWVQYLGKDWTLFLEGAKNFGEISNTGTGGGGGNVEHEGWMTAVKLAFTPPVWIQPSFKLFYFSGNDVSMDDVSTGNTNSIGTNKGYIGGYSLGNENLADTINTPISGGFPMLSMAGLHGVMKGVLRPNSFADPTAKENLLLTQASFNFSLAKDLTFILDFFDMWAPNPGYGQFATSDYQKLSGHLGTEANLILGYPIWGNLKATMLSAYFLPGRYYYENNNRIDTDPLSFSPKVGSENPDAAYSTEVSLKWTF
ncbi:MAG: hypothetical protein A3G92_01900 [Deltaproteobacteria bacterium RIFCSPLOWO2_12_FULL_38_8]|nr:MAG: hypothetical protein A3G92_01900 [Deltaproteobacteria bacterium RIFCSPLOWO2_12_FULL_38_8]